MNEKTIEIDENFFEHLLNCMDNQKFMPVNNLSQAEKETQEIIDKASRQARNIWLKETRREALRTELFNKWATKWKEDIPKIEAFIKYESEQNEEKNYLFVWGQIVVQEIEMFILLSTFEAKYDIDSGKFTLKQVDQSSFDYIIKHKQLEKDQRLYILETLKKIGIGDCIY